MREIVALVRDDDRARAAPARIGVPPTQVIDQFLDCVGVAYADDVRHR